MFRQLPRCPRSGIDCRYTERSVIYLFIYKIVDSGWARTRFLLNFGIVIGVPWLITLGGGGGVQNRPLVLGTLIYEIVNLERGGRVV
jgi:hypothetical protein